MKTLTAIDCRKILFNLGIQFGVSPKLISERLLSDLDKNDMMAGLISIASLEAHMAVWKEKGMPSYVNQKPKEKKQKHQANKSEQTGCRKYKRPFICHDWKHCAC